MNLEKLGKEIDILLENETEETLTKWLNERRKNANTSKANLTILDVSVSSAEHHKKLRELLNELQIAADNWAKDNSH